MPIDTRPVSTSTTATDTTEVCPYCRTSDRIRRTSDTGRVRAWSCDHCGTDWAYTVPDTRAAVLLTTDLPKRQTATIQHMAIIACIGTRRP